MSLKRDHVVKRLAGVPGILLILVVLQTTSPPVAADIAESFESGFGPWQKDMNYDPAFFDVSISSIMALDGMYSVKMQAHGLPSPPYPKMSVWIERLVKVPRSVTMDVGITFYINHDNASYGPENVLAYFGDTNPSDFPEFAVVGQTPIALGWTYYNYQTTVLTPASGWLYAAVGFHNKVTGIKYYFFDHVNLTGVSEDFTPPTITNLQPLNQSLISIGRPTISASYNDTSGIDTSSVILKLDTVDITAMASVTSVDVTYLPPSKLFEGTHNVYLSVDDNSGNRNKAVATWRFTVDTIPPSISNLDPVNHSTVGTDMPPIAASYADASGVNTSLVVMKVDSVDVTASATVNPTTIVYNPSTPLSQGSHDVYLSVADKASPPNRATATWQFKIDSLPPSITNQQPAPMSTVGDNTPTISADYNDASFVDVTSVVLRVDGNDVTSSSFVTMTYIRYTPLTPLWEGDHSVSLTVRDDSPVHNAAFANWQFKIDSIAPTIVNLRPTNNSVTSDTTPLIGANYDDSSGIDTTSVILKVDSNDVSSSATVAANGVTYTPSTPLSDGTHQVEVRVNDNSSVHNSAQASWQFRVDSTAPSIANLRPADMSVTGDSTPLIAAEYFDASGIDISSVVLKIDSVDKTASALVLAGEITYAPFSSLGDGTHQLYLEVRDASPGHFLSNASWSFTVDATAPTSTIEVLSPKHMNATSGKTFVTSSTQIRLTADDGPGVGVQSIEYLYYAEGETQPSYQTYSSEFSIPSSKPDGLVYVRFRSADTLGNMETELVFNVYLDNTAPVGDIPGYDQVELTYVNDALTVIRIDGVDGGSGLKSVRYGIDDSNCPSDYASPFAIGSAMTEGEHRIYYTLTDSLGNVASVSYVRVFLDTIPPAADAGNDIETDLGKTVRFDGTASADGTSGSGIVNYTWMFTYEDDIVVLYGAEPRFKFEIRREYEVTLRVTDRAGNTGSDSTRVTFNQPSNQQGQSSEFPWWVIPALLAVFIAAAFILLFALKKKKDKEQLEEVTNVKCSKCGRELRADEDFCSKCGEPVSRTDKEDESGTR